MICRIGSVTRRGTAVTVHQAVDPERVVAAVRRSEPQGRVSVDCELPTPVHDHVGHIYPGMSLRPRTALAAAGRTRDCETPHDDEIASVREQLAGLTVEGTGLEGRRQELAEERADLAELRETVATLRGRLAAHREHGLETADLERELAAKIRELAETETTATAARQQFERTREQAHEQRDRRERKFELEDRLANLKRDARRWLVDRLEAEYTTAVDELTDASEEPFDCRPSTAALAVATVASYTAPIVLETEQFGSAAAAGEFLDGPVLRL